MPLKDWIKVKSYWTLAVFFTLSLLILNTNPFGNNPEVIRDESYFLTSTLAAYQNFRIPGLDFSKSNSAYYGGPLTYSTFIFSAPVLGSMFLFAGSIADFKLDVLNHIGDLLHIVRLINGIYAVIFLGLLILLCISQWSKKNISRPLVLLLVLLLGSSLFTGMVHTGKIWTLHALFELTAGILVFLRQKQLEETEPVGSNLNYARILIWLACLATTQSMIGVFTGIWILYALFLRHINLKDLYSALKKDIVWIFVLIILNSAFFYNGYLDYIRIEASITDLSVSGAPTLWARIEWPLRILFQSQPYLVVLWLLLALWSVAKRNFKKTNLIGLVHPFIIFVIYYIILGFGQFPRYLLPLTVAIAVSCMFLFKNLSKVGMVAIIIGLAVALAIFVKTSVLFWTPASSKQVIEYVISNFNNPEIVLISNHKWLEFPLNSSSLAKLDKTNQNKTRFQNQISQPQTNRNTFKALVVYNTSTEIYLNSKSYSKVYLIENACLKPCTPAEIQCKEWNLAACRITQAQVQETTTWIDLFITSALGDAFVLRRIK